MPFYKDYSDKNATILYWKYSEEDHFEIDELIEPENLELCTNFRIPLNPALYLAIVRG